MDPTALPDRLARQVARWADAAGSRAWVVAVSGGGDSVALLRALHDLAPRLGLSLSVAHLDHGARGEAGAADAAFVAGLAATLDLPCDLGRWRPERPGHFEADARRARYAWLAATARARGAGVVAVGHTSDDQAETVLHRVVRGTGLRGLAGIPPRRPLGDGLTLVRPLLGVPRAEARAYLAALGQVFHDDATNADTTRTRARIRHDLLPRLAADYNPNVAAALNRLARLAAASERAFARRVLTIERRATRAADHERITLSRSEMMHYPAFLRAEVIRLAWRRAGWPEAGMTEARWNRLARLVRKRRASSRDVGAGVVASTDLFGLELRREGASARREVVPLSSADLPLEVPGAADWAGGRVVVSLDPDAPRDETIDLDRVFPPLWVRAPVPGDLFNPLGMGTRETALNDFFRGRRVGREARRHTPVVCDRFGIIWVVGHRIAHRVRLTETTTRRAALRWEPRH
jgi:tRNA(Ile)-lysidine synthase